MDEAIRQMMMQMQMQQMMRQMGVGGQSPGFLKVSDDTNAPAGWLQRLLGGQGVERLPSAARDLLYQGPVGDEDVVYRPEGRTPFLQRGLGDMGIVATPRPSSENLDELIRAGNPGTADARMVFGRGSLSNAQFNFAPGYLRRTSR